MSLLKAKFSSIKRTKFYLGEFTHDDSKEISRRIYSTFQKYFDIPLEYTDPRSLINSLIKNFGIKEIFYNK